MWKKCGRAEQATGDIILRLMRFACWVTKAKDKHSGYVIYFGFPLQQWLHEQPQCNVIRTLLVLFGRR
jgi:hypothetical protein